MGRLGRRLRGALAVPGGMVGVEVDGEGGGWVSSLGKGGADQDGEGLEVLHAHRIIHRDLKPEDDEEEGEEGEEEGLSKCIGKELKKCLQCHSHCK
ncbi:uncharacterized protein A4U43_C03F20940 [Asparagus officinalis]|uniref:Protein kinase domain-containing protein n=1 Tax=Asparagus officinalis TaxID=4686 RepID=A0A5P1FDK5_ASPOF|nr:uncharacterized protein A4U43_C03F20940 [Asparagus officinalis]